MEVHSYALTSSCRVIPPGNIFLKDTYASVHLEDRGGSGETHDTRNGDIAEGGQGLRPEIVSDGGKDACAQATQMHM